MEFLSFFKLWQDPNEGDGKITYPKGSEAQNYGWEALQQDTVERIVICEGEIGEGEDITDYFVKLNGNPDDLFSKYAVESKNFFFRQKDFGFPLFNHSFKLIAGITRLRHKIGTNR